MILTKACRICEKAMIRNPYACRSCGRSCGTVREMDEGSSGSQGHDPNARSLATVDAKGRPSSGRSCSKVWRMENCFLFQYNSRKAAHLAGNPHVSMHFPWFSMQRQVTILGETSVPEHSPRSIFSPVPTLARLGHGHRNRASHWKTAKLSSNPSLLPGKSMEKIHRVPPTGAGITCIPVPSNFGRVGPTVCMTDFFTNEWINNGKSTD